MVRLAWGFSLAFAAAGIAVYSLWRADWAWWIGIAMAAPLAYLAMRRAKRRGFLRAGAGEGDGGAWGPP